MKSRITPQQLLSVMRKLGYRSDPLGVCKGFALTGIVDFLSHNLSDFKQFVDHSKESKHPSLNTRAHFEAIELFQQPFHHRDLFTKPISCTNTDAVAAIVSSESMQKKGGLAKLDSWHMIYTLFDMQQLCVLFNKVAQQHAEANFAILLDNYEHTIGLGYNTFNHTWLLFDLQQLPFKEIHPKNLFEELLAIFGDGLRKIGLETTIYSAGIHAESIQTMLIFLKENPIFKKMHTITPLKAKYKTTDGFMLAHFAAYADKPEELKTLAKENKDCLRAADKSGVTPAFLAAQNGSSGSLDVLKQQEVKLDVSTLKGWTLAHTAADNDQVGVLTWLEQNEIPVTEVDANGWTSAHVAARWGHTSALTNLLACHKELKDQKTYKGSTVETIATTYMQPNVLTFFKMPVISKSKPYEKRGCGGSRLNPPYRG